MRVGSCAGGGRVLNNHKGILHNIVAYNMFTLINEESAFIACAVSLFPMNLTVLVNPT